MILLIWFDRPGESFSYKEVQFKTFCLAVKTSYPPAKNSIQTPDISKLFSPKMPKISQNSCFPSCLGDLVTRMGD